MAEHRGGTSFHCPPIRGWTFLCPRIGIWTFTVSTFRGTFYAILRYFGRNLTLWTIPCYRPKQDTFHDKHLISTLKNGYEETKKGWERELPFDNMTQVDRFPARIAHIW